MPHLNIVIGCSNILTGLLVIGVSIPLLQGKIKMNHWYGVRLRKSFESADNWYKLNRYGAQRLIFWSVILILIGIVTLFLPIGDEQYLLTALTFAPALLLISVIEICLFARRI